MFLYRVSIICGILKCLLLADASFSGTFSRHESQASHCRYPDDDPRRSRPYFAKFALMVLSSVLAVDFAEKKMTWKKCECHFGVPVRWQDLLTSTFRISYTYF